jgi:predicted O-methyltransferase YrrM
MSQITPAPIVEYAAGLGHIPHPQIAIVGAEGRAEGLPIVIPATGELLHVLVRAMGATRVLEIGTAIGYSGLWMATALPEDGMLITLERDETRARRARAHFAAAGVDRRTNVMIGDASRYLHKIAGPFDVIFQDGDKAQYAPMLDRLITLLRPGGLLVTDNVLWSGDVVPGFVNPPVHDASSIADISTYNQLLARDPRVHTTFLPVGDGVALSCKLVEGTT